MSDSSLNIQFNYLYRDAGNYKQFNNIIFSNPENISLENINAKIKSELIYGEYFVASKWQIPALQNFPFDEELDHYWLEFEKVETTSEEPTDERTISEFLNQLN